MGEIKFEKEVCAHLSLPAIPIKKWDGKKSFKHGVVTTSLVTGERAYALASFDEEKDEYPRIVKVFGTAPFYDFDMDDIRVVPEYMNTEGVEKWDLDNESKKAAAAMIDEANELQGSNDEPEENLPEWVFPQITNMEEAVAFIKSYKKSNKIKGVAPKSEEAVKTYLYVIYKNMQNASK